MWSIDDLCSRLTLHGIVWVIELAHRVHLSDKDVWDLEHITLSPKSTSRNSKFHVVISQSVRMMTFFLRSMQKEHADDEAELRTSSNDILRHYYSISIEGEISFWPGYCEVCRRAVFLIGLP